MEKLFDKEYCSKSLAFKEYPREIIEISVVKNILERSLKQDLVYVIKVKNILERVLNGKSSIQKISILQRVLL